MQRLFRTDVYDYFAHYLRMAQNRSEVSAAAKKLKGLRERARPEITVREMAEELGYDAHTSYAYYEDGYKKSLLPVALARKVASVLSKRGIEQSEVLELAGIGAANDQMLHPTVIEFDEKTYTAIGRYDPGLSAGPGSLVDPNPEPLGYYLIETQWLRALTHAAPDSLGVVRVNGTSMLPTLCDGDWVLIDRMNKRVAMEGIFAIAVQDLAWVKRISLNLRDKKVRIISDNQTTPVQDVDEQDLTVIGRVIALVARKVL